MERGRESVLHVLCSARQKDFCDVGELFGVQIELGWVHGICFGEIVEAKVEHDDVPLDVEIRPQSSAQPPAVLQVEESVCGVVGAATSNPRGVLHKTRCVEHLGHGGRVLVRHRVPDDQAVGHSRRWLQRGSG